MKNITLAIDEDLLYLGREYAKKNNTSFNALVRELVARTVQPGTEDWLEDTFALADGANISSKGRRWTREELYDRG
jgi:hypothetical protein